MIKTFCDNCGREITKRNRLAFNDDTFRLKAEVKPSRLASECARWSVEVITGLDGASNKGDFCKHCVLDAIATLDDRPKCMEEAWHRGQTVLQKVRKYLDDGAPFSPGRTQQDYAAQLARELDEVLPL